jgi:hypothetical protein
MEGPPCRAAFLDGHGGLLGRCGAAKARLASKKADTCVMIDGYSTIDVYRCIIDVYSCTIDVYIYICIIDV